MRRLSFILCIITFSLILGACRTVNINSADELLHSSWYVENESGIKAKLTFDVHADSADFIITDQNENISEISGIFAVDKDNFYITSPQLKKTYIFAYVVYKDRLILTYNGVELILNAVKEKEP